MFQCLGLGTVEDGGCGEDWWHPECLVGFTREEYAKSVEKPLPTSSNVMSEQAGEIVKENDKPEADGEFNGDAPALRAATTGPIVADDVNGADGNDVAAGAEEEEDDDPPLPPGFPAEDDFDHFICYKCLQANPWIKKYAGSPGFLAPVYLDKSLNIVKSAETATQPPETATAGSKKRKASDEGEDEGHSATLAAPAMAKRQKSEDPSGPLSSIPEDTITLPIAPKKQEADTLPKHALLAPLPAQAETKSFSLFLKPEFRDYLCHCASCFPQLKIHPQLLEEEDTYEPPVSEDGEEGAQSVGTGSLLDRGEAAFNNLDRVRAIQGAMAYAHLKDKLGAFLKPFAESGQAVAAEDIKAYFEKLRGDAQAIEEAAGSAKANRKGGDGGGEDGTGGDGRREQSGY